MGRAGKKLAASLLSIIMVLGLLPASALAASAQRYSGGSGTQADPYQMSTGEDLRDLASELTSASTAASVYGMSLSGDNLQLSAPLPDSDNAPYRATLTLTIGSAASYHLPDMIAVTMGGATLAAGTDYTYDSQTGAIVVVAERTADLLVTASAQRYSGGSGTQADPYQMSTGEDLRDLASELTSASTAYETAGVYFIQAADIDVASGGNWLPIGGTAASSGTQCFRGSYDGQNHRITGLSLNYSGASGLFGLLDCAANGTTRLANIRLVGARITNTSTDATTGTGGITAGMYLTGSSTGTFVVENCSVENGTITSSASETGGILGCGETHSGETLRIVNCAVVDTAVTGTSYVGGIAGSSSKAQYNYITGCRVTGGSVTSTGMGAGSSGVGGIAGYFASGSSGEGIISGCFSTAEVTAAECYRVSGLLGSTSTGIVRNCYATGNVTGKTMVGGAIGDVFGTAIVQYVFATGAVTAADPSAAVTAGGLFGTAAVSTGVKSGNVALNASVGHTGAGAATLGRVSGSGASVTYGSNYAYELMTLDGAIPPYGSTVGVATNFQGGNTPAVSLRSKAFWAGIGFDFTPASGAWLWIGSDTDGCPALSGFDGVSQTVAMPPPDTTPPTLSGVTAGPVKVGENISATSSDNGTLYLTPSATPQDLNAITAAAAATAIATAGAPADLVTTGLAAGTYIIYAVDTSGNTSGASAPITVTASDDTTPPIMSGVTTGNVTVGDPVSATSSENGTLYLVPSGTPATLSAIRSAAYSSAPATAGVPAILSTINIAVGSRYVVHAVDMTGNVSSPSAEIIFVASAFTVDGSGTLTAYTGPGGDVVIPSAVNGVPVTTISNSTNVFRGKTSITSVTIPGTVTSITSGTASSGAFVGCSNLAAVTFAPGGSAALTIGNYAFYNVANLTTVTLPPDRPAQIGSTLVNQVGVFYNTGLTRLDWGNTQLTGVGPAAFQNCASLTSATFPAALAKLASGGNYSPFAGCANLTSVTFESIASGSPLAASLQIDAKLFSGLANLATVVLPTDRPTTIGSQAFSGCTALNSVNSAACSSLTVGLQAFANTALSEFYINDRTAAVSGDAFSGVAALTLHGWYGSQAQKCMANANITFAPLNPADSYATDDSFVVDKTSGELLAYTGTGLDVTVPTTAGGVTITGVNALAFTPNPGITSLTVQAPVTAIPAYTFGGNGTAVTPALQDVILPGTVTSVGDYAFASISALRHVYFGENSALSIIGNNVFTNDSNLTVFTLPDRVETIGDSAFSSSGITHIELPGTLTSIGNRAFASTSLVEFELPAALAVITLGTSLFSGCESLGNVILPEGLTTINGWFNNCTALASIELPSTVTTIGNSTFSGCTSLGTIDIPPGVTTIGNNAFKNCTALKAVVVPDGATSLGNNAFSGCTALETLVIPDTVTTLSYDLVKGCNPARLVVYVVAGSTAATSPYISTAYCTIQPSPFLVAAAIIGAGEVFQDNSFTVSRGVAAGYGLTNSVNAYQVSALDALLTIHEHLYGWTGSAPDPAKFAADADGRITKIFGVEAANAGFTLNGSPLPISYAAETAVRPGDSLLFFTGWTSGGGKQGIAWFEFEGAQQTALTLAYGRTYTLTLATADGPLANMPVYEINPATGQPTGNPLGTTDAEGGVGVTFPAGSSSSRVIAGFDSDNGYVFCRLTITLSTPNLQLQTLALAGTPAFDTSSPLSSGYIAGTIVRLDGDGNETATTGFAADHYRYNVYVNAATQYILLPSVFINTSPGMLQKTLSVYVDGSATPGAGADHIAPKASGSYAMPPLALTGDQARIALEISFTEYGQTFTQTYELNILRDAGTMAPYPGILDVRGVGRSALTSTYERGATTSVGIYHDKGAIQAAIDVKVQDGTSLYLGDASTGTLLTGSEPALENGRMVVTYRITFNDFTKTYLITAKRDEQTSSLTVASFEVRSIVDGVYTPDQVLQFHPAVGQFVPDGMYSANLTLKAQTGWSKYVSLGGFGGYVDYYYDEPITDDPHNPYGTDFIIYGNTFQGGMAGEAAGVKVSYDGVNWYDLAGQAHYELPTHYDTVQLKDGSVVESLLIARTGENGFQAGYPRGVSFGYADVAACSIYPNAEGLYDVTAFACNPYNRTGPDDLGDGFDLCWAVDRNGRPVGLPNGIRYIRVQNVVDVPDFGALGEVSTEIGTVTRINPASVSPSPVGVTDEPGVLTINGKSFSELGLTPTYSLRSGQVTYYDLDLQGLSSTVNVVVDGADDDNIYVNNQYYAGEASYTGLLDSSFGRTVRVIVQNGDKEPRIYVVKCTNGGDPTENADLDSIVLAPGDTELARDAGGTYTATVENSVQYITLTVKALNPGATIRLGDTAIAHDQATVPLPVSVGANSFTLTITSVNGSNTKTYPIIVTRKAAGASTNTITVSFTFTGDVIHYIMNPDDKHQPGTSTGPHTVQTWIATTSVTVPEGSTVKYVTDMMLMNAGIDFHTVGGTYIDYVQIPGTNPLQYLGEFDNGPNSGWMYRHNGLIADEGYAARVLKNGDTVLWFYTDDYTKETGYEGPWSPSSSGSPTSNAPTTLAPKAVESNSVASAKISESDLATAIANAKGRGSAAIVIAPEVSGTAKKVSVELPKTSLSRIASETEAGLTVKTPVGHVTIPNDALASIASQAKGGTVTVSLASVDNSTLTPAQQEAVGDDPVYDINVMSGGDHISGFGGSSVTVSLPCTLKEGEDPAHVTVWYLNDAGELERMACTYDPETGMATFTTNHLSYYVVSYTYVVSSTEKVPPPVPGQTFTDVRPTDWYYDSVTFAVYRGLMNGTSPTAFSPNDPMTRAMLVTVLYRLEGSPTVAGTNSFTDVEAGEWYTDAVAWASANGIVGGYGQGLFGTNDSITRQQLAAVLYRYAGYKEHDVTKTTDLASYTDAPEIDAWAEAAVKWATAEGLITGRTETTLAPGGSATRAEAATILQRFCENIG